MASHIEGAAVPGRAAGLMTRLEERMARLVDAVKSRKEIRASIALTLGERVLVTACDSEEWVAASDRALYHSAGSPRGDTFPRQWIRLGWEEVGAVSWDDEERTLTLVGLLPTVARRTVLRLPAGASSLGALARERVASTAVVRTRIRVGQHGTARVIGRRQPGTDELTWLVALDGDRDGDAARMHAAVAVALEDLRRQLGV